MRRHTSTTTKTGVAYGNSYLAWEQIQVHKLHQRYILKEVHASKYKVHKLHQRYILKEVHASKYKVHKLHQRYILKEVHTSKYKEHKLHHVHVITISSGVYLVFTRMRGKSHRRRLRSLLLCLCDVSER